MIKGGHNGTISEPDESDFITYSHDSIEDDTLIFFIGEGEE